MSANKIMVLATVTCVIIGLLALPGCTKPEDRPRPVRTVEVVTPILEERPVPADLLFKPVPDAELPEWVAPGHPGATSCLTPEGEAKKRILDTGTVGKLNAWEKWGILP